MAEETPTPIFDESDDFNSTFNGTLPLPPAVSIFTILFNDLRAFVDRAQSDPLDAAREWPHVVVLILAAVFLPSLLTALIKAYSKGAKVSFSNRNHIDYADESRLSGEELTQNFIRCPSEIIP